MALLFLKKALPTQRELLYPAYLPVTTLCLVRFLPRSSSAKHSQKHMPSWAKMKKTAKAVWFWVLLKKPEGKRPIARNKLD